MSYLDDLLSFVETDVATTREKVSKGAFPYPGGKSRSLGNLLPLLPYRNKYIELFGGSGVVFMNRKRSKCEVFNDKHAGLVDFFKSCREKPDDVIEYLKQFPFSREDFIDCRDTWVTTTDPLERGCKWFYSIINSFTSQGRNFGRSLQDSSAKHLRREPIIKEIAARFKDVLIENQDFMQLLKDYDSSDSVFYLDPPYIGDLCSTMSGFYKHMMTREEHLALIEQVFKMKGFVAVSSYKNPLYEPYPWTRVECWEIMLSMKGCAFTESNKLLELRDRSESRPMRYEYLYIKE
jgi:DNA adenine methylase